MHESNLRANLAELIGTFAVVFVSAGAVCANLQAELQPWMLVGIALATGAAYAGALAVTVPISGGYLNPAITLMLWVFRRFSGVKTVSFIGMQLLGSAFAGLLLRVLMSIPEGAARATHLGAPHISNFLLGDGLLLPKLKGVLVELVLTFVVTFVIYGTMLDPRAARWTDRVRTRLGALWIGLAVVAVTLAGFPLTGAAINPARWLGPVIFEMTLPVSGALGDHMVYWLGPIAGALIAGWAYTALLVPEATDTHHVAHAHGTTTAANAAAAAAAMSRSKK